MHLGRAKSKGRPQTAQRSATSRQRKRGSWMTPGARCGPRYPLRKLSHGFGTARSGGQRAHAAARGSKSSGVRSGKGCARVRGCEEETCTIENVARREDESRWQLDPGGESGQSPSTAQTVSRVPSRVADMGKCMEGLRAYKSKILHDASTSPGWHGLVYCGG